MEEMSSPSPNHVLDHLTLGYPRLAGHMEIFPERAIFRRFGALNCRNLLYLQCELSSIEKQLIQQENADNTDPEKLRYALDYFWLSQSRDDGDARQLELVMKMRKTLKEYNDALLQQAKIHSLGVPDKWDLQELQHFLETTDMGPLALIGDDASIWGSVKYPKAHSPDIIALRPRPEEDPFSSWLAENAIKSLIQCGYSRWKRPSRVHGVIGYQDNTIFRITLGITSIMASLIPLASVAVLYSIPSIQTRIGVIGAFNLIIAVCLSVFTKVKRSDMFAISAAFTAVQVVFVNTDAKRV